MALYSNGRHKHYLGARSLPVLGINANDDQKQFLRILRALALLKVSNSYPFQTLFDRIRGELFLGMILIVVTPSLDRETWQRLAQATKKGQQVWIVLPRRLKHSDREEYLKKSRSIGIKVFRAEEREEVGTIELKLL